MSYWLACVALFVLFFVLTEVYFRFFRERYVNLKITDKDGTTRIIRINAGKDEELDLLLDRARKEKGARIEGHS